MEAGRLVLEGDALPWLAGLDPGAGAVVTSPPDMAETGQSALEWSLWFRRAVWLSMRAAGQEAPAVFYVTDRRYRGELLSKAHIIMSTADAIGFRLLWHKIALRLAPGMVDSRRPGYVHMLAVGSAKVGPGWSSGPGRESGAVPDVFFMGPKLYRNGMGAEAARLAVEYAARFSDVVVNPFCGMGTVLAAAEEQGLRAVGIDNDPDMCERARSSELPARVL